MTESYHPGKRFSVTFSQTCETPVEKIKPMDRTEKMCYNNNTTNKGGMCVRALLEKLHRDHRLTEEEYARLLLERAPVWSAELRRLADGWQHRYFGNRVYLRGVLDVSSICQHDCLHCTQGCSADPRIRYRLRPREILELCEEGWTQELRSLVLRCGTDRFYGDEMLCGLLEKLRHMNPDCAQTIAMGERSRRSYERLFNAGAEGYQLLQETVSRKRYEAIHSESLSLDRRLHCLNEVRDTGFQTGCGFLVGIPGQRETELARELKFLEEFQPNTLELVPVGPQEPGLLGYLLSILRLMLPQAMIVAPRNAPAAVAAGANLVQVSLLPERESFPLCCGNPCGGSATQPSLAALRQSLSEVGFEVSTDIPRWNG